MTELRAATWNLLHGRSLSHGGTLVSDLVAGAKTIDADVLALQEVDRAQERSGSTDQTAVVADAAGATWWMFAPSLWGVPGGSWQSAQPAGQADAGPAYGVGLVSRLPMLEWDVLRFPPAPLAMPLLVPGQGLVRVDDEPRVAIAAVLSGPSGPFTVIATHLSFVPGYNTRQLRRIIAWAADKPAPRLLLGDLNLPGPVPRWVSRWTQLARTATYPSWKPRVQFDHVLARGITRHQVRAVDSLRLPVSDHNALAVTLAV